MGLCRASRRWHFPMAIPGRAPTSAYAERLVKFLLWARGGWKVYVGGPRCIGDHIAHGVRGRWRARASITTSWASRCTSRPFTVVPCARGRGARRRSEHGQAAGPPPRWLPHRLRPGCIRCEGVGGGRRRSRSSARRSSGSRADRPTPTTTTTTSCRRSGWRSRSCRALDAIGGSSAGIYRQQPADGRLALPRHPSRSIRRDPRSVPAHPRRVRRAAGGRQRRRRDRAGRRDVARGRRRAGHRAGLQRGGRLRQPRTAPSPAG